MKKVVCVLGVFFVILGLLFAFIVRSVQLKCDSLEKKIQGNKKIEQEILYANYFHDSIKNSKWLKTQAFTPVKGAANYSFLYLLFSVIDNAEPKNILEMGMGQTTKVTSQYANYYTKSRLTVVEDDAYWIDEFKKKMKLSENISICKTELEYVPVGNVESRRYKNLQSCVKNQKFDLIIIDGPVGYDQYYSRTNIVDLIPQNLASDFVILLDDYDRQGEQRTAELIFAELNQNNIPYATSTVSGLKTQLIIASPKYKAFTFAL